MSFIDSYSYKLQHLAGQLEATERNIRLLVHNSGSGGGDGGGYYPVMVNSSHRFMSPHQTTTTTTITNNNASTSKITSPKSSSNGVSKDSVLSVIDENSEKYPPAATADDKNVLLKVIRDSQVEWRDIRSNDQRLLTERFDEMERRLLEKVMNMINDVHSQQTTTTSEQDAIVSTVMSRCQSTSAEVQELRDENVRLIERHRAQHSEWMQAMATMRAEHESEISELRSQLDKAMKAMEMSAQQARVSTEMRLKTVAESVDELKSATVELCTTQQNAYVAELASNDSAQRQMITKLISEMDTRFLDPLNSLSTSVERCEERLNEQQVKFRSLEESADGGGAAKGSDQQRVLSAVNEVQRRLHLLESQVRHDRPDSPFGSSVEPHPQLPPSPHPPRSSSADSDLSSSKRGSSLRDGIFDT